MTECYNRDSKNIRAIVSLQLRYLQMNIDGKKGSKVQRDGILNYNIANIY